jgi:hypothetical protein
MKECVMPILHKYRGRGDYYILTTINKNIVTFQITEEGRKKLDIAGIVPGQKFERALLLDLCRSGDALTQATALDKIEGDVQLEFDFRTDSHSEKLFSLCAECASLDDLHLVEIKGRARCASVLCVDCRSKNIIAIDTSIPLIMVTRGILSRMLTIKAIKKLDSSVKIYQELLDAEFESKWDKYRKGKPEQVILIDTDIGNQGRLI